MHSEPAPIMIRLGEPDEHGHRLLLLGFWSDGPASKWPEPFRFIDRSWSPTERAGVVLYLQRAPVVRSYRGMSHCRVCARLNGSAEKSDGRFLWPEGLAHYVEKHGVRPPPMFVHHAIDFAAGES